MTLFADTGNFKNAADIANQATLAFPQSAEAFVARGAANTLLGKLDQSHSDFATAVQLSPGNADARFLLALSDYKQGQFAEAITELKAAIACDGLLLALAGAGIGLRALTVHGQPAAVPDARQHPISTLRRMSACTSRRRSPSTL